MNDSIVDFVDSLDDACIIIDDRNGLRHKNPQAQQIWPLAMQLEEILPPAGLAFVAEHRHTGTHKKACPEGSFWITHMGDVSIVRLKSPEVLPVDLFQQITENLHQWVYIIEPDFRVVWANSPETKKLIGQSFFEIVPVDLHQTLVDHMALILDGGHLPPIETSEIVTNGGVRWHRTTWIPARVGQTVSHIGIFVQDVTQQREHDDALVRSESRYRTVLNNSLDIVALFSEDYLLQFVTPNVYETLGYRSEDLVGRPIAEIIDRRDRDEIKRKLAMLSARPTQPVVLEVSVRRPDGGFAHVEARIRITEPGSVGSSLICNARDITARKELEAMRQQLIRADKLAAVGQLAAGVAHEVNNPASYIYTNIFVLREYVAHFDELHARLNDAIDAEPTHAPLYRAIAGDADLATLIQDMKHMIDVNLQGMDRISNIVRELRMFSRDEADHIEYINLPETIEAAVHLVRNQIDHIAALEVEIDSDVAGILCDRGKLSQVLVNILVNAAHAVAENPHRDNVVGIKCNNTPSCVVISISDTGPGMTQEVQTRIFEPFFTTKKAQEGTGLGLWLCEEIVRKLGGSLDVWSEVGKGSTFHINLPHQAIKESSLDSLEETSETEYELRVLLVDDDEFVLESMRKILVSNGHDTTTVNGGREAMQLLSTDNHFDAVICDVMMPFVDGPALYDFIAESHPHLLPAIVFCTAGVLTQGAKRFLAQSEIRVLRKPVGATQLHEVLRLMGSRARKRASHLGSPDSSGL
jgi:PAS domain S-box-containing protein